MRPEAQKIARLYDAAPDARPEAIVVHCSDPRFHPAFEQFIQHELGLAKGKFLPLVVGGGAGVLAHPEQLPKEFKFMKDRFEFYKEAFPTVRRVVLINHEDCRYYDSIRQKIVGFIGSHWRGSAVVAREDLGALSKIFGRLLGHLGMPIDLYYARFADPARSKVAFEKIGDR